MKIIAILLLSAFPLITEKSKSETFTKDILLGKFEASGHSAFSRVPDAYASHQGHYLRNEVLEALLKMAKEAEKDGIKLMVVSAYRSYYRQKTIWNNKYNRYTGSAEDRVKKILRYSSMPGTSRHHWGTDFDLNSVEPAFFETPSGIAIYEWLQKNAHLYGFYQPYQTFNSWRDAGYYEEKWHWSYKPIADKMTRAYRWTISYSDISGFLGSQLAAEMDVIERYVLCVEPS
ncbi:MAG: M15 family metallopeptidase [Cryomorphaceae bacterium]|nr:M15 family metallopeptidase [Cryomorphaceae bacterium]